MAAGKRVGTQLLIVTIAGALIAVLVARLLEASRGGVTQPPEKTASTLSPAAPADADALGEGAIAAPRSADAPPAAAQDQGGEPPGLEQRAAAVVVNMTQRLELHRDSAYANELVRSGLSRTDSETIVRRFYADVAKCGFEDSRRRAEAQGTDYARFLAGAEVVWSAGPEDNDISVGGVAMRAMPCVADAAQRAGIALPPDLNARYAALEADVGGTRAPDAADPPPPQWAEAMEAAIRAHVARHPAVAFTNLDVRCNARGCSVVLEGGDIPVYDLDFDAFAEQNGFHRAAVFDGKGRRVVWLER